MSQIEEWLLDWFAGRGFQLESGDDYFDAEAIDSFGVIELIEAVERRFDIKFAGRDFQDRRFVTINGLAEIVDERLQQG